MNEVEEKFRQYQASTQASSQAPANTYGVDVGEVGYQSKNYKPNLQDRISTQLTAARQSANKLENLKELSYLLDKNPEVARILNLLELVSI